MSHPDLILVVGASGIGRKVTKQLLGANLPVRVLVRADDDRAAGLRAAGAETVVGDLTRPESVATALVGVRRMYFGLSVSPDHLLAATVLATVARKHGELEALVGLSQMTVSQMTATSTSESHQQRLHWLAEQVLDWSDLPVMHVRPTMFLDNPLFTDLAARSIRRDGTLTLPFGTGRTSPVAADDVARVIATLLSHPEDHFGNVYELTGPHSLDMNEAAEEFSKALGQKVTYRDVPLQQWRADVLAHAGLPEHTEQHILTMAQLHRTNRYDRTTTDVERVTGQRPQTIEQFVALRKSFYLG